MVSGFASCSHDHLGNAPFDVGHFGDDVLGWTIAFVFDILCVTVVSTSYINPTFICWNNTNDAQHFLSQHHDMGHSHLSTFSPCSHHDQPIRSAGSRNDDSRFRSFQWRICFTSSALHSHCSTILMMTKTRTIERDTLDFVDADRRISTPVSS